jgi:hypothetical protein
MLMLGPDDKILTMDEKILIIVYPGDVYAYMQCKITVVIDVFTLMLAFFFFLQISVKNAGL